MSNPERSAASPAALRVSQVVRVSRERAFDAWTDPRQIIRWWGPPGVACPEAHVDLRVGGVYAIANQFDDGRVVWIRGTFEAIERPQRLVFTWRLDGALGGAAPERVTVRFEARGDATTEVIVEHERIASEELRRDHETGWVGCLEGLAAFVESTG